ncbi:cytochrome P450 [Aspergillus karnatakaensis]|uniref:cytochrome P450 monooxygenase gliF n=1 Tax=Aspergillus karnatakaensis TaxID=1810916 RepID=UPI003CCD1E67
MSFQLLSVDWHSLWTQNQSLAPVLLGLGTALFLLARFRRQSLNLPRFEVTSSVLETIEEAHAQYPDDPFILSMVGMELVILPRSGIDVIKALPEEQVSIKKHHHDVFLGEYTYMGTKAPEFDEAMRYDLTRNTPTVLSSFVAEVQYAVEGSFGRPHEWKAFQPRASMSRIASLMSGRAFVGLPLSRDETWVQSTVTYTQDVTRAWLVLRMIPWLIRPFVAPFLPQVRSLKNQRRMTEERLKPLLNGPQDKAEGGELGGDMLRWFRQRYPKNPTPKQLARDQLLATFASIYNLSNALTYLVFDLASYPEHIEPLRKELEEVLKGEKINKENIQKLKKLDSFIRESQRLSPPSLANMPRIVTSPSGLKLPSGHTIPQGMRVMVRAHTLNHDPKLWENPSVFDGFRFSKLRELPGNTFKYQHATTGTDNINFGHGLWACPGRHFASSQMKVVLAHLLLNYDICLPEGVEKPQQRHFGLAIVPDEEKVVLLRVRGQE